MSDPITPIVPPEEAAAVPNAPPPIEQNQSLAVDAQAPSAAEPAAGALTEVVQGSSPIKRQHRDGRGSEDDYVPHKIIFLTGSNKGKTLDLGLGANEEEQMQSAAWPEKDGDGIRDGVNFKGISNRTFRLTLEYYDRGHNILHLTENVHHLQEITGDEKQPPFLMYVHGETQISPVVCTSLRVTLDSPHSQERGFKHAKIEIEMKLIGGKESEHSLGKPLAPTPLGDARRQQTDIERQREGAADVLKLTFAECVGEAGSAQLAELIDDQKLGDVNALLKLEANALVQSAIAGMIPGAVFEDERLKAKLSNDLAAVMARNENGVGNTIYADRFASALISGEPLDLPSNLQQQALATRSDYIQILDALLANDLTTILEPGMTAGERIRNFGRCGFSMRNEVGGGSLLTDRSDGEVLDEINTFLRSATNADIAKRFGLDERQDSTLIERLKNGQPYQAKEEFLQFVSDANQSVSGYSLWGKFANSEESADEGTIDGVTDTDAG